MFKFKLITFFGLLAFISAIAVVMPYTGFGQGPEGNGAMQLNCDERPCDAVARGRAAFNDRNLNDLGGNGRACSDCHMPSEGFQLSPASAQSRFEALQVKRENNKNADDPLFRPVDADDFRINGDNAIDFSNLVENGLIRITMPLPLNVKLIDPATGQTTDETSVDLWRAVMPVPNVAITGPDGVLPIWPAGAPRPPIMGQVLMAPTGRAATSTMRASEHFRNKPAVHSSRTPRCRWSHRRACSTTSRLSSRCCSLRPGLNCWPAPSSPAQRRSPTRILN